MALITTIACKHLYTLQQVSALDYILRGVLFIFSGSWHWIGDSLEDLSLIAKLRVRGGDSILNASTVGGNLDMFLDLLRFIISVHCSILLNRDLVLILL